MPPVTELLVVRPEVVAILPPVLAALFWLWLAVAVGIYIFRLVRRLNRRGTGSAEPAPTPAPTPPPWPAGPRADVPPSDLPHADLPTSDVGSSEAQAPREAPAPFAGVAEAADPAEDRRTGFFAPAADAGSPAAASGGRRNDAPRPTVVEATRGITMPCNLSPVIDGTVSIPNPFRVAFLTTDADAATVGAALGDELQRLGFSLTTPATTELLARKPGVELRVVLYPTASAARRGLDAIFPAAPDHAVGVEFTT